MVPQNQPEIIDAASDGDAYLAVIDGIGQEDIFYYDEADTLAVDRWRRSVVRSSRRSTATSRPASWCCRSTT